jgi:hypothetical protein
MDPSQETHKMRIDRISLGVVGIVTMLSASAATAQATKGPSGVVHACSLFTDADIARITGRVAPIKFPADTSALPGGHTECHWINLGAALTPKVTRQTFGATRKQQEAEKNTTIQSVSGVGDEAYFWQRPAGAEQYVGIVFRVGQYQLALSDMLPADSVAWLRPKLAELARFAAPKLK